MTGHDLAQDYLDRARRRLRYLDVLHEDGGWADVVRESQEAVELALKGLLRRSDVGVPRVHDVSEILREHAERLPKAVVPHLDEICEISRALRRDRELAFYGSEDLTPTGFYRESDARDARRRAQRVIEIVARGFGKR